MKAQREIPPVGNALLAALPKADRERIVAACEPITLAAGTSLGPWGHRNRHALFPTTCYISLIAPIDTGQTLEVGMVGYEGMLGIPILTGVHTPWLAGLVQGPGAGLSLPAARFTREMDACRPFRRQVMRYTNVLVGQFVRTAACTRFHKIEARLAFWLLITQDRARSNDFLMTQQFLARMLGVQRTGVTQAAGALQARKLIRYVRGRMTVLDRAGLEAASCSCYSAVNAFYREAMGRDPHADAAMYSRAGAVRRIPLPEPPALDAPRASVTWLPPTRPRPAASPDLQ